MKTEWRPIAEWGEFIKYVEAQNTAYFEGKGDQVPTSWVALGWPGDAANEREPSEDHFDWVFASLLERAADPHDLVVAHFPMNIRAKKGAALCRCYEDFWDSVEICASVGDDPDEWEDISDCEYGAVKAKHVAQRYRFTHFYPISLPPVPGTPYAHNARVDGTQAEHLTTDGAEPPANSAS